VDFAADFLNNDEGKRQKDGAARAPVFFPFSFLIFPSCTEAAA
jgi:hypothetical protein